MKVKLRSLIKEIFSMDAIMELYRITKDLTIDNNDKRGEIIDILNKYGYDFEPIGSGTNRYTVIMKGYIFKFSLDEDGMIDNLREFKYSKALQPYVIKCYEVLPDGLIMVCEYVEVMTLDNFYDDDVREKMKKILGLISDNYFIGDIGIDVKNYTNWGFRKDIYRDAVILDFAYCYSLSFRAFKCIHCKEQSVLFYNDKYTSLICPTCNKTYSFKDIRRRISKGDQEKEIGDITKQGYVLHSALEEHEFDPRFSVKIDLPEDHQKHKKHKDPLEEIEEIERPPMPLPYDDIYDDPSTKDETDDEQMFDDLKYNI